MLPRLLSRRSSRVAWTTVTHCSTASATDYFNAFSRCRTLPLAWSQALVVVTTSRQWLHWLPVRQRVAFKIAGLVHQSLAGSAPAYLADDCHLLSDAGRRPLRSHSNDIQKLLVPRTHNKLGDRSFSAAGPRLERASTRTAAAGTFLRFFQTISENTSLWRLKRLVTLFDL